MTRVSNLCLVLAALLFAAPAPGLRAQSVPTGAAASAKLEYIMVFDRHGVRTPLWTNDRLNEYSTESWPAWNVQLGYLTEHGRLLMKLLGDYQREYLAKTALIKPGDCADASRFYFWSDVTPRDIESGQWLAKGLFPNCAVDVPRRPRGDQRSDVLAV
jgi:4-phytase / acid phosphatase